MKRITLCLVLVCLWAAATAQAQWRSLGGTGKDVAISAHGKKAWTLGPDGRIYTYATGAWQEYPGGGRGLALAVTPDGGTPYVIGTDNGIYRGTGNGWSQLPGGGKGKDIAVDGRGAPWVIGMDDDIYSFNGMAWNKYPGNGRGLAITVAHEGTPLVIGTDNGIYRGTGSGWMQLSGGGKGKDVAVDGRGRVWVIGMDDAIYFHRDGAWSQLPGGGRGHRIAVDAAGTPLVIGMDQAIWIAEAPAGQPPQVIYQAPPLVQVEPPRQQVMVAPRPRLDPTGTWRHHPEATWTITQSPDGRYFGQENGLGNASGPAHWTASGTLRIDYVTRDGSIKGYYEVGFAPDGMSASGSVRELSGPMRSGATNWTRVVAAAPPAYAPPPRESRPVAIEMAPQTSSCAKEQMLYTNGNGGGVQNAPTQPTRFQLAEQTVLSYLMAYHWNNARGQTPGTIALQHQDGSRYGPWQASGAPGQGGVPNAYWSVRPNVVLKPGNYVVIDSNPATWAQNAQSGGQGMVEVKGCGIRAAGGMAPPPRPRVEQRPPEGRDYSDEPRVETYRPSSNSGSRK